MTQTNDVTMTQTNDVNGVTQYLNDTSIIMIMLFMTFFLTCVLIHAVSLTHANYSQIIQSDRSVPFSTDNKPFAFLQTNIHMYCLYTSHAILRVN